MHKVKKAYLYVSLIRSLPLLLLFNITSQKTIINEDIARWIKIHKLEHLNYSKFMYLHLLVLTIPEFRNLLFFRCRDRYFLNSINKIIYPRLKSLYITDNNIGGGLYIQHGFSTVITANTIGENCWINQQVTIGWVEGEGCPTIGNGVYIYAGAVVIGNINIGDNSIIGANTTIVKNVPQNCTVVGSPAYIIKRNGIKVHEKL